MQKSYHTLIIVFSCLLGLPLVSLGEDGGSWVPNLNPFSRPAGPPTSARVSNGGGLKMPKIFPSGNTKAAAAKPKGPSTWQKMTTGTKTIVAKTADALNPFDDAKDNQPVRVTGSKNAFRQASAKKNETSGSWLPSLWGPKEEAQRPKSVNDFLSQPRPQP